MIDLKGSFTVELNNLELIKIVVKQSRFFTVYFFHGRNTTEFNQPFKNQSRHINGKTGRCIKSDLFSAWVA